MNSARNIFDVAGVRFSALSDETQTRVLDALVRFRSEYVR